MIWVPLGILLAAALLVFAFLGAALLLADQLTRTRRRRVRGVPGDAGLRCEEIQFLSSDNVILRGWYVPSPGARATVILIHGEGEHRASERYGMLDLLGDYVGRGFNVFTFDLRGHGESAGARSSLGAREVEDVEAAVDCIRRHTAATPLILHGFGTGATFAIVAAQRSREVAAVIADTPVATVRQHLRERMSAPLAWLLPTALRIARRWFAADADALAVHSACRDLDAPVLMIHGVRDPLVPLPHSINLAAASLHHGTEVWRVEAPRDHAGAYRSAPPSYMRRCIAHIDAAVPSTLAAQTAG